MDERNLCFEILSCLYYGIYYINYKHEVLFWNQEAERITGYTADEMKAGSCELLRHQDKNGICICGANCLMSEVMVEQKPAGIQAYLLHKDDHRVPVSIQAIPVIRDGVSVGALQFFTDDTQKEFGSHQPTRLLKIANTDALTGLQNRRSIEHRLEARLSHLRQCGQPFWLLFLDIDNFKQINDRYGHNTGDLVLTKIAELFRAVAGAHDVVGRWGGEELMGIFLPQAGKTPADISERLHSLLRETAFCSSGEERIFLTVSIGATAAKPGDNVEFLVDRVDRLMYYGKKHGKNCTATDYSGKIHLIKPKVD